MQFLRTFWGVFYAKSVGFWGSAPDPSGGAYSAPPHPLAGREGCPPPAPSPGRPAYYFAPPLATPSPVPPPPPSQFLDPPLLSTLIKHIQVIASATITDPGCPRPPVTPDNLSCLSKLECPICLEILSRPIELPCSVLACAECAIEWLKVSGTVLRPCCHSAVPMALWPASDFMQLLLNDVLVHCPSCGRDMRTSAFAGHECTSSPTRSEVNMAADVLRHVVPNSSPDECMVKVPTEGRVKLQHHARQGSKTTVHTLFNSSHCTSHTTTNKEKAVTLFRSPRWPYKATCVYRTLVHGMTIRA